MTEQEKIAFKLTLKAAAQALIEQRISNATIAIEQAQQAANNEEKSSAGDKYETARAMGHLEKDMHARQLAENVKELALLHSIPVNTIYPLATAGTFIRCTSISFFIAAGLGKQTIQGGQIIFLSPQAPLAQLIKGKKAGDSFLFNGTEQVISALF
jgi:transcription elongation GreA/GreB family factor